MGFFPENIITIRERERESEQSMTKYSGMNCIQKWDGTADNHTHASILTSELNAAHYHGCKNEMTKTVCERSEKKNQF